ncbi:type II secretion system F family protein [bacterium]|nr:type II secretion system F family protein [bacterium]
MPVYSYTALKNGRETIKGEVTASNPKDARDVVRKMGLVPINIEEFNSKTQKKTNSLSPLSLKEKIDFISTLQILLQSGIPAVESLMFMEQEAARKKIRDMSKILKTQIMAGSTFADTLARYPQVFGYIFIGLIKAGEESGELEKTLGRISDLLTKQENVKSKVIGTLMYPIFVIILAFIITIVMLVFVFPAFKDMFEQQDKALPFITKMMIDAGEYLKEFWYTIPLFITAFVVLCIVITKWQPAKNVLDKIVLKIPLLNNLILYSNYSNFLSVLSVSYDAGIPIVDCLHLGVITLTNSVMRTKMSGAIVKVQQGLQVSQAFKSTKIMPKMLLFMVSTGEQSGRLGDMLQKGVNFLDKILDGIIDTMTKMIEPIMLIVIGSIVLVMALALYLPLFQSYMS